ncbi:MAG: hypothetical protein ACK54F_09265 [Planctomycetia bacterium]|jgi:hypothetical protein
MIAPSSIRQVCFVSPFQPENEVPRRATPSAGNGHAGGFPRLRHGSSIGVPSNRHASLAPAVDRRQQAMFVCTHARSTSRLEVALAKLAEAQARTESQLERLAAIVEKLVIRADRHEGTLLELMVHDRLPSYLGLFATPRHSAPVLACTPRQPGLSHAAPCSPRPRSMAFRLLVAKDAHAPVATHGDVCRGFFRVSPDRNCRQKDGAVLYSRDVVPMAGHRLECAR